MSIDFTPLDERNPKHLRSSLSDFKSNISSIIFMTCLVFVLFLVGLVIEAVVSIFLTPYIHKKINTNRLSLERLSNFAIVNGFTYRTGTKNSHPDKPPTPPEKLHLGGVIGKSMDIQASNIIEGKYKDFSFILFNPHTKGPYTIMKVPLQNLYPHIVLDSRFNDPYFSNSSIGRFFDTKEKISLEGDFDKYFLVYSKAPKIDVLRILSPDTMERLIKSSSEYDIEIHENSLHVIANFSRASSSQMRDFFEIVDSIMEKLDRRRVTKRATFDSSTQL